MFLRNKRVGTSNYIQLVESSRRNGEPRLKIIANLGRVDQLKDSGVLNRLARNFSSYSSDSIILDRSSPAAATRIPPQCFQDMIVEQAAKKFNFEQRYPGLFGSTEQGWGAIEAISAILFRSTSRIGSRLIDTLTMMAGRIEEGILPSSLRTEAVATHIYILPNGGSEDSLSPLRGTVTATIAEPNGRILSCTNWPGYVPLPEVIRQQIGRVQVAYPERRPVVFIARKLVNNQLLGLLAAKHVQFVAPLRESAVTSESFSLKFHEERLEFSPLKGIEGLRYFRAVDGRVASIEAQIRDLQLSQVDALRKVNVGDPQAHAKARAQIMEASRWDGTTLIATNMSGQAQEVVDVYHSGQRTRQFQEHSNAFLSDIATHMDFPRSAAPLVLGFVNAQAVASTVAEAIVRLVSATLGREILWPDIAELLKIRAPVVVGEKSGGPIAFPADEPILDAILGGLDIEIPAVIEGVQASMRYLARGRGDL